MEDMLGFGKMVEFKSENVPAGCLKSGSAVATTGWACDRTDCPSYGKWYCPFSW